MENKQLRWACRRGMRELDLLLQPFFDQHFEALTKEQQSTFEELLTYQDPDLFNWFIGKEEPADGKLKALIQLIKERHVVS